MSKIFSIDAGNFDKKITIQKYGEITYDSEGFPTGNGGWNDYKTVWANVNSLYGSEFWSAKAVNEQDTKNFVIRWSKDLADMEEPQGTKKYRIVYKNKQYDITFVDNIGESNTYFKIKAKTVN